MALNIANIIKAIVAGLGPTLVLTALMLMKKAMGVMPGLDPVHMMADMVSARMGMEPIYLRHEELQMLRVVAGLIRIT